MNKETQILLWGMLLMIGMSGRASADNRGESTWVTVGKDGKLVYQTTPRGDRIADFSHAGYRGGGVALPLVKTMRRVKTEPGITDYTDKIQKAIDEVSALPLRKGVRGAVELDEGEYPCNRSLLIAADGVVVRGCGEADQKRSTIVMSGQKHAAFVMCKTVVQNHIADRQLMVKGVKVVDSYVPFGSYEVHVKNSTGFKPGDEVLIMKPVTKRWIAFMRMNDLKRDGKTQTWLSEGTVLSTRRTIDKMTEGSLHFTVPLVDAYDALLTNDSTRVVNAQQEALLSNAGVEHLRIVSPAQPVNHTIAKYFGVRLNGQDCWLRDIDLFETMESIAITGRRITLQRVSVIREARHQGSSKPAEFAPNAGQVLMDRCYVKGDNIWSVAVGARVSGPIVLLNCHFEGDGRFQGHQRWSTAFLLDNCSFERGGIDFMNRGEMGSGHGWGTAWAVAWNCTAKTFVNQQPPGCYNWMIGCKGERVMQRRPFAKNGPFEPEGTYDSHGSPVTPCSLYLTQLRERLGNEAVKNIGY